MWCGNGIVYVFQHHTKCENRVMEAGSGLTIDLDRSEIAHTFAIFILIGRHAINGYPYFCFPKGAGFDI